MGLRIDGHPGSHNAKNAGDALHFCMPGVPDFGLDFVLRAMYGRFPGMIPGRIAVWEN